jgi:hypothetical protein
MLLPSEAEESHEEGQQSSNPIEEESKSSKN